MLRPALRAACVLPRSRPPATLLSFRAYTPSLPHQARRATPLQLEPIPNCSPSASSSPSSASASSSSTSPPTSPLDVPPPAGSDPLPPPPHPRSIAFRRSLLLFSLPIPPSSWPSHLDFASPLLLEAGNVLKRAGVSVNAVYDGTGTASFPAPSRRVDPFTPGTNSDSDAPTSTSESKSSSSETAPESYPARLLYPDGKVFDFPAFNEATLDSAELKRAMMYRPSGAVLGAGEHDEFPKTAEGIGAEVLVCTHGSRDCRCSDHGQPLVDALRREGIMVREIAHVGGHKYAANALLLPSLDLLSNLRAADAPSLATFVRTRAPTSPMWAYWRGRMGLNEEQQLRVWERIQSAFTTPSQEREKAAGNATAASTTARVGLTFRTFNGEVKNVQARVGDSLLEVAHEKGLPAMEGTCGGNAECATCHLYLAPRPSQPPVPDPSEDELDMLDFALDYRDGLSRLGCQIEATPELARWCAEGGVIDLPRF